MHGTDRQTDGGATLYRVIQVYLGRARCCCRLFLVANCTNRRNILFANSCVPSFFKPPSTELRRTPTSYDLQPKSSELLKRSLSKTSAPSSGQKSATSPNFWKSRNRIRGVWKVAILFLSYKQKTISRNINRKLCVSASELYLTLCIGRADNHFHLARKIFLHFRT